MRPSERASGEPAVAVLLCAGPPPAAAFNADPDQQEPAESCGGARRSQKLRLTGARLAYCFNVAPQNSGGAVSSAGGGSCSRVETGQYRLAGKGPTSQAVRVKRSGWETSKLRVPQQERRSAGTQSQPRFTTKKTATLIVNNNKYVSIRHHPTSVCFLIQMWK